MLKVVKFGGSSLADARQFEKVRRIVQKDKSRRVVVVSAPGKRSREDHKITDLLYLCAAHIEYGVSCEKIFGMIRQNIFLHMIFIYNIVMPDRAAAKGGQIGRNGDACI